MKERKVAMAVVRIKFVLLLCTEEQNNSLFFVLVDSDLHCTESDSPMGTYLKVGVYYLVANRFFGKNRMYHRLITVSQLDNGILLVCGGDKRYSLLTTNETWQHGT